MKDFLTFHDRVLKTICHIYKHKDGRTLHLLPVIHIGEKRYYEELLDYIGEKICVYESIEFKRDESEDKEETPKTPKSFDEWIQYNENLAEEMDTSIGREIKRFQRRYKVLDLFTRRLRRMVKKNLSVADKRFTQFFHQLERTNFSLHNITIQQYLLAETLELSFQHDVIDYENDIPNRKNWIHGDISVEVGNSSVKKIIENYSESLTHPTPTFVQLTKTNASQFYGMLYFIETLGPKSINERRAEMAEIFTDLEQEKISGDYVDGRNKIIIETINNLWDEQNEVMVFYGAAHMDAIKKAAENLNFKLISTIDFLAFGLKE